MRILTLDGILLAALRGISSFPLIRHYEPFILNSLFATHTRLRTHLIRKVNSPLLDLIL